MPIVTDGRTLDVILGAGDVVLHRDEHCFAVEVWAVDPDDPNPPVDQMLARRAAGESPGLRIAHPDPAVVLRVYDALRDQTGGERLT